MAVLVVEDNPLIASSMELLLSTYNIQCVAVHTGPEALRMARSLPPDLIVTDLMMAPMSGQELIAELAKDETLKNIPVIVISAYLEEFEKVLAPHVIIFGKPMDVTSFVTTVKGLLDTRKA